ncbi:MAG: tetratricopeptide repeat protein [Chitinispirillaceae bacterium]
MSTSFCCRFIRTRLVLLLLGGLGVISSVKSAGLPGEYLVSDRWRQLYSHNSAISNPAFINEENYLSARFLFASTLKHFYSHEAGVTYPIGLWSAAGVTWVMQGTSEFESTDELGEVIDGQLVKDQNNYLAFTFAHNIWSGLTLGMNASVIHQNIPHIAESNVSGGPQLGFGVDLGLTYKLLRHPLLGTHLLGLSTQNLFTMILDTDETYTRALRASLASDFWEKRILYGADFTLKDIGSNPGEWFPDSTSQMEWEFSQKLGFNILRLIKLYVLSGWNQEGFDHYGFAAGANMPGFVNGRDLEGLLQYTSIYNQNTGDASHLAFYLRAEVGHHREEIYARKMAKASTMSPSLLYNKALEAYYDGKCYDAYWLFAQINVDYPDFFKNDWVNYYLGACLECMDMRESAVEVYKKTKENFSRSVAVPHVDLGLMRVFYRQGEYASVENQFNTLNQLGVPDSIKHHSYYIMGQSAIQQNDYTRARELFTMIPETHPDYVFAYHSAAVANMLADNIQGAISDLESVIQIEPETEEQKEVINRSYVFLGYLYYEDLSIEGALARAVTALRQVPEKSYYYQDALMGLGWTALKARQWHDCLSAGSKLSKVATDPVLQCEGKLLQAYGHYMQKQYDNAVKLLDEASAKIESYSVPTEADLSTRQSEYSSVRSQYSQLGSQMTELSMARQSAIVQNSVDSLRSHQKDMKGEIDDFLEYTDEFERSKFFARSIDVVKEDIDYALAKISKYANTGELRESMDGTENEAEDIDEELEELRKMQQQLEESGETE